MKTKPLRRGKRTRRRLRNGRRPRSCRFTNKRRRKNGIIRRRKDWRTKSCMSGKTRARHLTRDGFIRNLRWVCKRIEIQSIWPSFFRLEASSLNSNRASLIWIGQVLSTSQETARPRIISKALWKIAKFSKDMAVAIPRSSAMSSQILEWRQPWI